MGSQQFCLKWNNHQSNLLVVFDQLLQNEAFVDVTLACEGLSLKAHKMVLSACSPYFQSLFLENPCKHPIVILNSMRYCDLKAIIDFMYKGEVNVSQEQLSALLKTAEMLKVKGLAEVTNQTTQTLMTQSVVVPPLDSRASPTLPEQVGQPPPSSTSQRSSVSPPPKRKKLRSSAVSSSASSPQTPSMSTASLSSQKAELHNANLDTKIVPPMVLPLVTDLSQDGHSNHDHQADQNLEQNQDHLMDAPPEISEDHSSTSNLTEKGFEKSGGDQTSQDPHSHMLDLAFQNLPSTPSTSGIQTATGLDPGPSEHPVIIIKDEAPDEFEEESSCSTSNPLSAIKNIPFVDPSGLIDSQDHLATEAQTADYLMYSKRPRRKMKQYRQYSSKNMNLAITKVMEENWKILAAAKHFNVPRSTLGDRVLSLRSKYQKRTVMVIPDKLITG